MTYTVPESAPNQPFGVNPGLQCQWSGVRLGQCREEGDYAITFSFPPCGCRGDNLVANSHRFCLRHMLRAFHSMMGLMTCPSCGKQYRGIQRLERIEKI